MSRVSTVVKKKRKDHETLTLTDGTILQIKDCILNGKNIAETAVIIGFPEKTVYGWIYRNAENLGDKVETWKMERTLELAEAVGRDILTMVDSKEDGTINPSLRAIKQREAEYVRDALVIARKKWSKKDAININVQLPQPILGDLFDQLPKATIVDSDKSLIE